MSKTDTSAEDILWSITGFDKIAIQKAFSASLKEIQESGDDMEIVRALAFVHMKREGMPDRDARQAALELSVRDLTDYFPEPESNEESGKDSTA